MQSKLSFSNSIINTLLSVALFVITSSAAAIPAAALSIFIHLSVYKISDTYNMYFYPLFILLLIILGIYFYKKKSNKRIGLSIISAALLPVFIGAGYPLLKFVETAAHICGGENYLFGVLFYAVLPVSAGYFTLTGTYIMNMYNKRLKEKMLYAVIYFLFASAVGFTLLIYAYNCGDL